MRLICIELLRCIYYTHIILIFLSYLDDCFLKQRVGIASFVIFLSAASHLVEGSF